MMLKDMVQQTLQIQPLLFLFLLLVILSTNGKADNYVLLSGLAWHEDKQNTLGEDYEWVIPGVGFQHRRKCEVLECSATAIVVRDSNRHVMYSGTLGVGYKFFDRVNTGLEFGMASRVVYGVRTSATETIITKERQPIGIFMPKIEVDFDWWMLNLDWIPPIHTNSLDVTQALYINIGIKLGKRYNTPR